MNSGPPRIDATELQDLKDKTPLSDLFARYGVRGQGKTGGPAIWAKCCFHGEKTASLKINDERGMYHCFGCGANGDHFDVLRELAGKSFHESVEALGGQPMLTVEERQAIQERNAKWQAEEDNKRQKVRSAASRLFEEGNPIAGTHAEAYLSARGIPVVPAWTFDLRFVPALTYRGFADDQADETVELGRFPAMIAAIRDRDNRLIGVHRTYLDPDKPAKLTPPGDQRRNKAKKILGEQRGGLIRLSGPARHVAIGEGIETSRAWFALGMGGSDEVAVAAAVSLGNLSGGATGSAEHPVDPQRRVPNGEPDMERPGVVLPREVEIVTLIGDGDSDPHMTRARLLVAARRFHRGGIGVFISMAPESKDFCDLLAEEEAA